MELFGVEIDDHIIRTVLALGFIAFGIEICFDTFYFIRMFICFLLSKFWKKKIHILEKCSLSGICLTRDVDIVLNHMNNARFLREVDLARIDFYIRTGLYSTVRSLNGHIWLAASTIRYRKFIKLFQRFKITTKVVYWDESSLYIQHKFSGTDGFVHAVMYCQYKIVQCAAEEVMEILLKQGKEVLARPEPPPEVKKFIELQEAAKRTAKNYNNNEVV